MVDVTVIYKRRNKDYFQKQSMQDYAYTESTQEFPVYILPRAGKETLEEGNNDIVFATPFPNDTEYILWSYTYDDNNYQVGSYIVEEEGGEDGTVTGFTIYAAKACTLRYIATPIK
jgi:hypothetical protein